MGNLQIKNGNAKKDRIISDFISNIDKYKKSFAIIRDNGLNANEMYEARSLIKKNGNTKIYVLKNRLVKKALNNIGINKEAEVMSYLKGKNMFIIADNSLDTVSNISQLPKEIKLKIDIVCLSDKTGIIDNKKIIKDIIKNHGLKGTMIQIISAIQNPIMNFAQIANIKGN